MPREVEIYCYSDPAYSGDKELLLVPLREAGYRVVEGADLLELMLLLELSEPLIAVYALAYEGSRLSAQFHSLSRKALELGLPLILIGPEDPGDDLTFLYPGDTSFEESIVPSARLIDAVEEIREMVPSDYRLRRPLGESAMELGDTFLGKLHDKVGDGEEKFEIETEVVTDHEVKIVTTVKREGVVLIREESAAIDDDSANTIWIEEQHLKAVNAYSPASDITTKHFHGEISGPIVLPERSNIPVEPGGQRKRRRRILMTSLVVAAICFSCGAIFLATLPVGTIPREIEPVKEPKPHVVKPSPMAEQLLAKEPVDSENLANNAPVEKKMSLNNAIPFPGYFRPGKAVFFFKDEWEKDRFIAMIGAVPTDRKIRVVGHPTSNEAAAGDLQLGLSRAWAVIQYLSRLGIDRQRMTAVRGEPVLHDIDLDKKGLPRNRWVSVIIK
jgi:outer membrane protein OmpA-like peptidoglycan-associated protein